MSFVPHQSNPQTSAFTCNTCSIKFVTAELQRQHMKTEWHRYNLKRRVASLPSISSDVFAEKILNQEVRASNEDEDEDGFYVHRRKTKNNTNRSLTQQLAQQKLHKYHEYRGRDHSDTGSEAARGVSPGSVVSELSQFSLGDSIVESGVETGSELNYSETSSFVDIEVYSSSESDSEGPDESEMSDDESVEVLEAIPISRCFYCGTDNKEVEANIKHMYKNHGLYIPERSYLVDLMGLLVYLSEAISLDFECLVCGFEGKNLTSIRQHMYSKGHCKLPYETKDEKLAVAEFYNFDVEDKPKTPRKTGRVTFATSDDNSFEDVTYNSDEEQHEGHGINDNYTLVSVGNSQELMLPTGSKLGHRALARYHRQKHAPVAEPKESCRTVALVDRRFAPGITARETTKQEKETRRVEQRLKNTDINRTKSYRANFQKHHVDQLLGPS